MVQQRDASLDNEGGLPNRRGGMCYLNNAGLAPLSPSVQRAGSEALQRPPWEMEADDDQREVRRLFSRLIGTEESCIATMPSTAFAITLAAANIQRTVTRGGTILVLQDQMCSAVYGLQNLCDTTSRFSLVILPYPTTAGGWTQSILERLADDVVVACLPPLHWSDGAVIDLDAVGAACRKKGIALIVDATQACGIMPLNVATIKPTMLACSTHKWLRGPVGMCLVYVNEEVHQEWLPLDQHGRSRDHHGSGSAWDASKNEMGPKGYSEDYLQDARKLDSGGKPNPLLLPMLRTSLMNVVNTIDVNQAQMDLKVLMQPLLDWARTHGWGLTPGPYASHLVGLRPSTLTPQQMLDICSGLQDDGIYIAVRCGAFRISPYVDSTSTDIERLIAGFECQLHKVSPQDAGPLS
jgi:selenocysteine lyase/cysteine desulfurase